MDARIVYLRVELRMYHGFKCVAKLDADVYSHNPSLLSDRVKKGEVLLLLEVLSICY